MPHSSYKDGSRDRQRINLREPYELRDWSAKLGVTKDELAAAVGIAGDRVSKVQKYLRSRKKQGK